MAAWLCLGFQTGDRPAPESITGHFARRDRIQKTMLIAPHLNSTETGCVGPCVTRIRFSDPAIPAITIKDCIGGSLTNLGDLDNDGLDEIGLLPDWFEGCWRNYRVFTFKHGQWQPAVPSFPVHCNEMEAPGVKPIVKDPRHPGNVLVTYSVFKSNDIVFKTRSEPIL